MNAQEAIAKAHQIFAEERRYPTIGYSRIPDSGPRASDPTSLLSSAHDLLQQIRDTKAEEALDANRRESPRTVLLGDHRYQFKSANYNLLVVLLGRVEEAGRSEFLKAVAHCLNVFPSSMRNRLASFPSWSSQTSELPLVAEFLIRNGAKSLFFETLRSSNPSPGIAVMLSQLGEIIAVNYPIFSEAEYAALLGAVGTLRNAAYNIVNYSRLYAGRGQAPPGAEDWTKFGFNGPAGCQAICELCDEVRELCRKAQFLHLKSALTESINLEVNQDKYVVEAYLEKFGFSGPLLTALNEAERLNTPASTEAELKSSMGHLRSFLEHLHGEAIPQIQSRKKIGPPAENKFGTQLTYLRVNDFLSPQEEKFVGGLFAVISDEAVHPLIARREYARLTRNVVIEYALLFLRKLEKL